MKIVIAFTLLCFCQVLSAQGTYVQKKAGRLIAEVRSHVYVDNDGKEYFVPMDSVHYGYKTNRQAEIKYAYNNMVDTDKYPEMAYLPDPGFFDIYPANCDTAMKLNNIQTEASLPPNWFITYQEANNYGPDNYIVKKTDLIHQGYSTYKYDNKSRLILNYIYTYDKTVDSAIETGYIHYTYNDNSCISSREFMPVNAANSSGPVSYSYNPEGYASEVRSPNRRVNFTYDTLNKTRIINMQIAEAENVAEPLISVRCSYVYDHGNVVAYRQEKYDMLRTAWKTITKDTITYDDKHHATSFDDGKTGFYHSYKIRYNTFGQPVIRTADETNYHDTHTLPDGSVAKLSRIECRYYYEVKN